MALKIGLVGCGNISDIYLSNAKLFRDIEFAVQLDPARGSPCFTVASNR